MIPVGVQELQRAWRAVEAGAFRNLPPGPRRERSRASPVGDESWDPGHRVLPVLGCHGACGASTLAVALATTAGRLARVVEAASMTATGLGACATAEMGDTGQGWLRGTRGAVVLEHNTHVIAGPGELPRPTRDSGVDLTVLDVGWEAGAVYGTGGWLASAVFAAPHIVLVTAATVPGMRRLEGVLHLLSPNAVVAVAVLGPRLRRWPREVTHSLGERTRALARNGALVQVPRDPRLAVRGLDNSPLPAGVLAAAGHLLQQLTEPLDLPPTKGQPE